jgi:fermentation-respiration switch protein FrsA (DUF1100 family)
MPEIVTTDRVRFANGTGDVLIGDLYRPHRVGGRDLPALVVTGSWMTVKEQMAGLYARRMAERGFISLAFDFTGFGQSAGTPRDVENPLRKAADIHAALDYLETVHGADSQRLGALAICASSGYTAANAAVDARIRSVGLVAPWLHNAELVKPYYGGTDGVADRIKAGDAARQRYELDGTVEYIPAVSETNPLAAMFGPYDYYLDPSRGAIPEWAGRFATMAWEDWLTYDPLAFARDISQPVRMIHSRDGAVPAGAEAFAEQLAGPAELIWTDGSQLDFYDQPAQVDFAVTRLAEHFDATL